MKRRLTLILTGLLLLCPSASGAEVDLQGVKLKISGGLSFSGFRETKTEEGTESSLKLEDAVFELKGKEGYDGFDVAVGSLQLPTLLNSAKEENKGNFGLNRSDDRFGLLWGYVELNPTKSLEVEGGILPTNVGYELAESYRNFNITYGLVWNNQPFIYRGVRATYTFGEALQVYGEYDRGKELNGSSTDHAFGLGVAGVLNGFYYTVNYFDYGNYKNLLDFTLSTECKNVKLGLNGDYQWLDGDRDKSGFGIAAYLIPEFGNFSLPLRLEYVKDRNKSGIYGFNGRGTYSFSLTPTYKLSKHSTVRTEFSYVKSNYDRAFNGSDHKEILSFQFSLTF